jgi:hypothetical protein
VVDTFGMAKHLFDGLGKVERINAGKPSAFSSISTVVGNSS